jgi:cytochrome b561
VISLITLAFALWHYDYYGLASTARPTHGKHGWLRPGQGLGLWLGFTSAAMIIANLAYLLRRAPRIRFTWGSLERWMTSHVATGIFALLCAMLHGAMAPSDTSGGHAFWALAILLVTGAIGRYFYAWVPRATNGRELELAEVKSRLGRLSDAWDKGQRRFQERARTAVLALVEERQWGGSFRARAGAIFRGQRDLTRLTKRLADDGRAEGVAQDHIQQTIELSRQVFRTAVMVRRYEDLRAVLNTWRYLHRWVAALMVLLVVLHIFQAVIYGSVFNTRGAG